MKLPNGKSVDLHIWDTAGQERFTEAAQCSEIICAPTTPATVQVSQRAKKAKRDKCGC
jgi:GTPase SAR1 family protein